MFLMNNIANRDVSVRPIDPALLQSFAAVADTQSFARAARRFNKTQPAISTHIRRLEELLDMPLVVRRSGGRNVSLTASGAVLLPLAQRMLALQVEAWKSLKSGKIAGSVRLGVTEDHAADLISTLVGRFRNIHPDVSVDIQTGMTLQMRHEVGSLYDIVVAAQPFGNGGGEALRQEKLVWLSKDGRIPPREEPLPLALYPEGCLYRQWAMAALDRSHTPWRVAVSSPSRSAILAAVAAGFAITVLPVRSIPSELRHRIVGRGLPLLPKLELALYRGPDQRPAMQTLADFIVGECRSPGR
jgi:DNA-binding transcriptional LysR family regulator